VSGRALADCQSAIQPIANRRYKSERDGSHEIRPHAASGLFFFLPVWRASGAPNRKEKKEEIILGS
jgi:hypothetical protein